MKLSNSPVSNIGTETGYFSVSNGVRPENTEAQLAKARAEYFNKADQILEKIRLEFGEGPDGFEKLMRRQSKNAATPNVFQKSTLPKLLD